MRNPGVPIKGSTQSPDQLLRLLDQSLKALQGLPFADGIATGEIITPAANTDFLIAHKLDRSAQGFLVTSINAAGIVYLSPNASIDPEKFINLRCSAGSAKIKLFIF